MGGLFGGFLRPSPYNLWYREPRPVRQVTVDGVQQDPEHHKAGWLAVVPFLSHGIDYGQFDYAMAFFGGSGGDQTCDTDAIVRHPDAYGDEGLRRAILVHDELCPAMLAMPETLIAAIERPDQLVPWVDHEAQALFDGLRSVGTASPAFVHGMRTCAAEYLQDHKCVRRLRNPGLQDLSEN